MNKILLPFDFSTNSENAFSYTLKLAKLYASDIHVLNVMSPLEQVDNNIYNALYFPDYMEYKKELMEKVTNKYLNRYPALKKFVTRKIETGVTVPTILAYALKENIDLIIIGSSGYTPATEFFLGSTTASLAAKTKIPLLVVPPEVHNPSFKRVSFATDLNPTISFKSKLFIRNLLSKIKNKIYLVHVLEDTQKTGANKWKDVEELFLNHKTERHDVHSKDATKGIALFVESIDSDLLIMIRHRHSFIHNLIFTRQTKQILKKFNIPILVLND